jgi:adenylate cyclase
MRGSTRRRVHLYLWFVSGGLVAGAMYGSLIGPLVGRSRVLGAFTGAVYGTLVAAIVTAFEVFAARTKVGRAVDRAPFLVTLTIKVLVYGAVIAGIELLAPGSRLLGLPPAYAAFSSAIGVMVIAFTIAATFVSLFVLQVSRLVGVHTLRDIVLGRYHRPRVEERFFLFLDIVGSTPIAERLGPEGVHRFLDRVFRLAAEPIDDARGQIYQYVGDEMVVTWTAAAGRVGARPLTCFFAIEAALTRAGESFARRFGATPRLRAALHAGPVIAGEVGDSKREIVFHGDVMNTASRLEQVSRDLDRRFVASADALERLEPSDRFAFEDLGVQTLRGRTSPIRVFAVEEKGAAGPGQR